MARIELKPNDKVYFVEDGHRYFLKDTGEEISGITSILKRQLQPGLYEDVPEHIMETAREYGVYIHQSFENFDSMWINDGSVELQDYIALCNENELSHEKSEWLLSDNKHYASFADKIFRTGDDTVSISDIKSYLQMDAIKLMLARFQLSIYAMWLEAENPGIKVDKLYIIHICNKQKKDGGYDHTSKLIEVKRIPAIICQDLLDCDLRGEQFHNPYSIPESIARKEDMIRSLTTVKKQCEEKLNAIKSDILQVMLSAGVKTWETESMKLTRKESSVRQSFNLTAFRKDNPDFDTTPYMKESVVSESLLITL